MTAEPMGIATELAERRERLAARMSPNARHLAFPGVYPALVITTPQPVVAPKPAPKPAPSWAPLPGIAPEIARVLRTVSAVTDVHVRDLLGPFKPLPVLRARQFAYMMMKRAFPRMSSAAIGKVFGRDHTTILCGLQRSEELRHDEPFAGWLADPRIVALGHQTVTT